MKKVNLIILSLLVYVFFIPSNLFAQELFLRNDKYFTELYLKLDPKNILDVEEKTDSVVITFSHNIKKPFTQNFTDKFILSVSGEKNKFTININKDAEYSIVNDLKGVKVVVTKEKSNLDTLPSYDVAKPLFPEGFSKNTDDEALLSLLEQADSMIAGKEFPQATQVLNRILSQTNNEFFRQEAMYKLGQVYFLLGQLDPLYYSNAYNTLDEFSKSFPDNFRTTDALLKSAEAKELANQQNEALKTYRKIYETVPDLETKRYALKKMAELYEKIGDIDSARNSYLTYLNQFKTDEDMVNGEVGQIYYNLKDVNLAFEYFSQLNIDKVLDDPGTSIERLHAIADTMFEKNRFDQALKVYTAIYEKYPEDKNTSTAIYRAAEIKLKQNKVAEADNLMLKLKELYPDQEAGQRSSIDYAEKYLDTKPYDYWNEFFKDLLARPDLYGLHEKAKYMLIQKLYKENRMPEAIEQISNFLGMYPESERYKELNTIKEDFLFGQLSNSYNKKEYLAAEPLIHKFNNEYPQSKYNERTAIMLNNIKFSKVEADFKKNDFKKVIASVNAHLALEDTKRFKDEKRWVDLLDESTYRDLNIVFVSKNYPESRVYAREYLSKFKNYKKEVSSILEKSFMIPLDATYKKHDFPSVVQLYDANSEWINSWPNKDYSDKVKTMVGMSVYRLGSPTKARTLYAEITPNVKNSDYAILGLLLGDRSLNVDVNDFDKETFKYIIGELEQYNTSMAIDLLDNYSRDVKFATEMKYNLAKNIPSDAKRQFILMNVYDKIRRDSNARFTNSEQVYMDIGLVFFRKNDFKNAVVPLKQFIDMYKKKDDRRSEALYYLGKSFITMGDVQRGFQYYNEIINTIPESIYAGIAKGEMDEDNWRKSLNNY